MLIEQYILVVAVAAFVLTCFAFPTAFISSTTVGVVIVASLLAFFMSPALAVILVVSSVVAKGIRAYEKQRSR